MSRLQGDSLAIMQRSLVPAATTRLTGRRIDGAPVYEYVRTPGAPPLSVQRFSTDQLPAAGDNSDHAHAHDFLVLAYFERGAGSFRLGNREWPLRTGDAFVIAPGEVVRLSDHGHRTAAEGWCVFFPPGIIASETPGGSLGWKAHPLLFRFVGRAAEGAQRLPVPAGERAAWSRHVNAIERELHEPRDGSTEAALAHLTLLLVSAARISVDIGQDFRLRSEPLMAAVFEFIEEHYHEPISLATIAAKVGLTPGHLTTDCGTGHSDLGDQRPQQGLSAARWCLMRRMVVQFLCSTGRGLAQAPRTTVSLVPSAPLPRRPPCARPARSRTRTGRESSPDHGA
jgi:quercetin dioxygenase-like cupin family protein